MQVRIDCPACGLDHVFEMPEGTIHMTCARTGKTVEVNLTGSGDPKARLAEDSGANAKQPRTGAR